MRRIGTICRHLVPATCDGGGHEGGEKGGAPLAGLRVVELATVLAAPLCGALLADYGAEVIKIEDPASPDTTRGWGRGDDPAKTADPAVHATVEGGGSAFVQLNRGKMSVALDPRTAEGKRLLKQLLATADVFITNVRPRSLRKVGLDYEALQPEFPKLIYAHLTAFGRGGEMQDDPGYDFGAFWAMTGLMDITRAHDDAPMPRDPGGIGDYTTAMQLLGGVFAALYHRGRTGEGQLVDACLMRSGVWTMGQPLVSLMGGNNFATMQIRGSTLPGDQHQYTTKAPFKCKDGAWLQLLGNDVGRHMSKLPKLLGLTEEGLYGPDMRNIDWVAANRVAAAVFAQRTIAEWEPLLHEHDVWYTPVHRFEDLRDPASRAHRQAKAVGSFQEARGVSRHDLMVSPVQLSAMPAGPRAPAPVFGQHTDQLLGELGVPPQELAQLKERGVVAVSRGLQRRREAAKE